MAERRSSASSSRAREDAVHVSKNALVVELVEPRGYPRARCAAVLGSTCRTTEEVTGPQVNRKKAVT
jgi:hypothetical protein